MVQFRLPWQRTSAEQSPAARPDRVDGERSEPATPLMMKVAEQALNPKVAKRVFSDAELKEILARREAGEKLVPEETQALREKYRKIKRWVKETEIGNNDQVIIFPSLTNGVGWYKVADISALYYTYRLAPRFGRNATIMKDTDKFSKVHYTASITNMEKLVTQMKEIEGLTPEINADGVYIFKLKEPLTEDEIGALRRTEDTKRERLHSVLRPKQMDPAVFQAILMVVRQIEPRVRKMDKQQHRVLGDQMIRDVRDLIGVYYDYNNELYDKKTAGREALKLVNRLFATITFLSEARSWNYDTSAMIGSNINELRRLIIKDFGLEKKYGTS